MYKYLNILSTSTFIALITNYLWKNNLFHKSWNRIFSIKNNREKDLSNIKKFFDCSKVYLDQDKYGGIGVFAKQPIQKEEIIEKGIVRVLNECDGNKNPHVFTWSDEIPNQVWAIGSGCSTFYNTGNKDEVNIKMHRDYINNQFLFIAIKDIKENEELLHLYKSKGWRKCFKKLNNESEGSPKSEKVPPVGLSNKPTKKPFVVDESEEEKKNAFSPKQNNDEVNEDSSNKVFGSTKLFSSFFTNSPPPSPPTVSPPGQDQKLELIIDTNFNNKEEDERTIGIIRNRRNNETSSSNESFDKLN
tara:strand:+ start:151 stop:1056 length:906 start_codon:yes stop_codon:yes gene_type:complete